MAGKYSDTDKQNFKTKSIDELKVLYPHLATESLLRTRRKYKNADKPAKQKAEQPVLPIEPKEPDPIEETSKDRIIQRQAYELKTLRANYQHVLTSTANIDDVIKSIEDNVGAREPVPCPPRTKLPKKVTQEDAVLVISDLHIGEYVDERQTGGIAVYNLDIAKRRLDYTVDTAIEILKGHLNGYNYRRLYVFMLGDLVSGEIHTELEISNEVGITQQKLLAIDWLEYNLAKLCQEFEEVHVTSVVGNHGRKKKEYYFKEKAVENNDYLIAVILRKIFSKQPNITFNIPQSYWAIQEVQGRKFFLMHGDGIKSWGGMPFYGLNREYYKWRPLAENTFGGFNDMIIAHFHTPNWFTVQQDKLIINGCLKGGDEYSLGAISAASDPVQLMFSVHPKHGITWHWPINSKHIR